MVITQSMSWVFMIHKMKQKIRQKTLGPKKFCRKTIYLASCCIYKVIAVLSRQLLRSARLTNPFHFLHFLALRLHHLFLHLTVGYYLVC